MQFVISKSPDFFCDFSCNRKSDILIHESTHTGVEPYTCQTCEKSFPNESVLKRHKLSHTGEKNFPCKYCKKAFTLKHHLVVHERIHTGRGIYFTKNQNSFPDMSIAPVFDKNVDMFCKST